MNPLGNAKEQMARRMMERVTPSEQPVIQALADSMVGIENRQAVAIQQLVEAADLDVEHGHDPERRRELMLGLADAVANDNVVDWWFATIGPEVLDDADDARAYVDLDANEWHEQLRTWFESYRDAGVIDDPPVDDLEDRGRIGEVADRHVQSKFGVSLDVFVDVVVAWDRGARVQDVLAGPSLRHARIIELAAEECGADES